jgi:membrane protease YdiL (CAAX protease family)
MNSYANSVTRPGATPQLSRDRVPAGDGDVALAYTPPSVSRPAGPRLHLAALIRRFPLTAFLVWFFTVGQAIAFVPVIAGFGYEVDLPPAPFLILAAFVGLLLPAVVITWITDGPEGITTMQQQMLAFKVPARWYAFAVVGVPLISVAAIAAFIGWPEQVSGSSLPSAFTFGLLLPLAVVFVTVNWAEETAWMGFFQARLQARHGAVLATVITGPLFAFGHISQLVQDSPAATLSLLALMIVICIPFRALLAWIYNRTGSIALVGLVHAVANATAAGSILGTGLLDRLYPGQGHGGVVIPILAVVGLVVLTGTRGRLGLPTATRRRSGRRPARAGGATRPFMRK